MNQLQNIVLLRSFAIVAVVVNHCFTPGLGWEWYHSEHYPLFSLIFESVLSGRMPMFVCVSGYLFSYLLRERGKYQTLRGFLGNKFKRLLLPCLLFSVIMSVTLHGDILYDVQYHHHHLWFLKMLFFCFVFTWFAGRKVTSLRGQLCMLVFCFVLTQLPDWRYFAIGKFMMYWVFFYGGFLLCAYRTKIEPLLIRWSTILTLCVLFLLLALGMAWVYHCEPELAQRNIAYQSYPVIVLSDIIKYVTVLLGFALVGRFLSAHPHFQSPKLMALNNLSYGIYLLHVYFLLLVEEYCMPQFLQLHAAVGEWVPLVLFVVLFPLSAGGTWLIKQTRIGRYLL